MKFLIYFIQYVIIIFLFVFFKILGLKISLYLSSRIFLTFGPLFRSYKLVDKNLTKVFPNYKKSQKKRIFKKMWVNYGKLFCEYVYLKNFRHSKNYEKKITIENKNILEKIKISNEPVIFISGHFNNFELMAMYLEKFGINLAAVYRPLNNRFLNPLMEKIRKKYICRNQIKKGISGTRHLLQKFKNKSSIALMIDQRVSEGIRCNFFNTPALTTTIPAQFAKKYNAKIVPVYIHRLKNNDFIMKVFDPISFDKDEAIPSITLKLNLLLEKMILKNPDQWIWTHNRWK